MKRVLWIAPALIAAFLAGCGALRGPDADGESRAREDAPRASERESLLTYFERVRKLPAADLAKEHNDVRQLYAKAGSDIIRVRYAMLLSVPGASFSDDARALELLDPLLKNPSVALHAVAYMVGTQIQEQRRGHALQQRFEEERRRAQGLQQRFEEEQRRGHGLQQRFEEEQRRGQGLQQKLDALKSLEKNLLERERGGAVRRR